MDRLETSITPGIEPKVTPDEERGVISFEFQELIDNYFTMTTDTRVRILNLHLERYILADTLRVDKTRTQLHINDLFNDAFGFNPVAIDPIMWELREHILRRWGDCFTNQLN